MNYLELFTPHDVAAIADWLTEEGHIFVRIERPHSGSAGDSYTVRTLGELRRIVALENGDEVEIFIFRGIRADDEDLWVGLIDDLKQVYESPGVIYLSVRKSHVWSEGYGSAPSKYESWLRQWFGSGWYFR